MMDGWFMDDWWLNELIYMIMLDNGVIDDDGRVGYGGLVIEWPLIYTERQKIIFGLLTFFKTKSASFLLLA